MPTMQCRALAARRAGVRAAAQRAARERHVQPGAPPRSSSPFISCDTSLLACQPCQHPPTSSFLHLAAPQSPSFPVLHKWQEVVTMDYKAAARGRRLWSMFERWITAKNGSGSRPLAIEMGSRAG